MLPHRTRIRRGVVNPNARFYKANDGKNVVEISGACIVGSTPRSFKIQMANGRFVWISREQIHDDSEVYDPVAHAEGKLVIPEWLAEREGLA